METPAPGRQGGIKSPLGAISGRKHKEAAKLMPGNCPELWRGWGHSPGGVYQEPCEVPALDSGPAVLQPAHDVHE